MRTIEVMTVDEAVKAMNRIQVEGYTEDYLRAHLAGPTPTEESIRGWCGDNVPLPLCDDVFRLITARKPFIMDIGMELL